MRVERAREIAKAYVEEREGLAGAYLAGSILALKAEDELDAASDVDVVLVVEGATGREKPGKALFQGLLIEGTYLDAADFADREKLLTTHYIGYALARESILSDPRGLLARAQATIRREYAAPYWANRRVQAMLGLIETRLAAFDPAAPLYARANAFFFTAGIAIYPALLAVGENLTVRKRYQAARRAMESHGEGALFQKLYRLLTGEITRAQCLTHMRALEKIFDLAAASEGPSAHYPFRADIRPDARAVAIGGCYALLAGAHPLDAVFWMGVTFARSYTILAMDAAQTSLAPLQDFLADLGLGGRDDFLARLSALRALLPEIEASAGRMIANAQ